jgi:PST family polysaccharide transporter
MRRAYFDKPASSEDLHRRSLRSGAISMVAQGMNMAIQVVSIIVLARLLLPEDFGFVAMVAAITGFGSLFVDLGTRDAVAQRDSLTEGEMSALFWITLGTGLALTAATVVSAPLLARFYEEPRLEHIAMALSLTFVLPALYFQQYALMRRALMFKKLAAIDVSGNLLATVFAIILAYQGYGYWALVSKQVLTALFTAIGVWISCGWWPGRPTFTTGVKDLLKFGINITAFTMSDYVAKSADRVALGYTTGPRELGYYQNAFVVYDNPLNLFIAPLHNVATATLSKLRADLGALKRAWSIALSSLTYFAAPAFAVLAVTGQDLVVLLLGSKWADAGAILSILALRGPAHVVERTLGWLHVAAGRPDRRRHWGLVNCVVLLVALFCGLPFGAVGVAAAYTAFTYLLFVPAIAYAGSPLGIGVVDVLKTVGPQVITALGVAALGFLLSHMVFVDTPPLVRLLVLSVLCGTVYLAAMTFGFRMTRPLAVAASLIRRRDTSHR